MKYANTILAVALVLLLAPSAASANWAVAFGHTSQTLKWQFGISYNAGSPDEAATGALSQCRQAGRCELVAHGDRGCAALAVSGRAPTAGWVGLAAGGDAAQAEKNALANCGKATPGSCAIQASFCEQKSPLGRSSHFSSAPFPRFELDKGVDRP